jgi:hypothetical protein
VFGFAMATREELLERAFGVYDVDRSGELKLNELHDFIIALHSQNQLFTRDIVDSISELLLTRKRGAIQFDDFVLINDRFPLLLYPIFELQVKMRKLVFGPLFDRIDVRVSDLDIHSQHWENLQDRWSKRKDSIKLYLFGCPCICCRLDEEDYEKRKKDAKRQRFERRIRAKVDADRLMLLERPGDEEAESEEEELESKKKDSGTKKSSQLDSKETKSKDEKKTTLKDARQKKMLGKQKTRLQLKQEVSSSSSSDENSLTDRSESEFR